MNEFAESQSMETMHLASFLGNHSPGEDFLLEANKEAIGAIFVTSQLQQKRSPKVSLVKVCAGFSEAGETPDLLDFYRGAF
ncbi:hypothetical protein N9Y81_04015 [Akkermansiaceae bacterium]|nr:hypothetical protein [Akkermansiaceae bacterium]